MNQGSGGGGGMGWGDGGDEKNGQKFPNSVTEWYYGMLVLQSVIQYAMLSRVKMLENGALAI